MLRSSLWKKHSAFKSGQPKTISNENVQQHFEKHFDARDVPFTSDLDRPDDFQHLYLDKIINIKKTPPDKNGSQRCFKIVKMTEVLRSTN